MYQYVLLETILYEGQWILGVVDNLDRALEYFSQNTKPCDDKDWENYISYWVEEWDKTKRLRTYKYNTKTRLLDKQKPRRGELE
jgi:hypothetical protein